MPFWTWNSKPKKRKTVVNNFYFNILNLESSIRTGMFASDILPAKCETQFPIFLYLCHIITTYDVKYLKLNPYISAINSFANMNHVTQDIYIILALISELEFKTSQRLKHTSNTLDWTRSIALANQHACNTSSIMLDWPTGWPTLSLSVERLIYVNGFRGRCEYNVWTG